MSQADSHPGSSREAPEFSNVVVLETFRRHAKPVEERDFAAVEPVSVEQILFMMRSETEAVRNALVDFRGDLDKLRETRERVAALSRFAQRRALAVAFLGGAWGAAVMIGLLRLFGKI